MAKPITSKKGRVANLQPPRTSDEARERGRNGGIASGKARREKRSLLNWALAMRDERNPDKNAKPDDTQAAAAVAAMYREARHGNVSAFRALCDLMQETEPRDNTAVVSPIVLALPTPAEIAAIRQRREKRNAADERRLRG